MGGRAIHRRNRIFCDHCLRQMVHSRLLLAIFQDKEFCQDPHLHSGRHSASLGDLCRTSRIRSQQRSIVCLPVSRQILVTILQCQPTNAWWNRFNPTHPLRPDQYKCTVDSVKFFYGNAIPTIVTDILMLALPLPYITSLQLPKGQKWALAGIFLVGLL